MSDLKLIFEGKTANERTAGAKRVVEMLTSGKLDYKKMSIRDVAEATLGRVAFDKMMKRGEEGAFIGLRESTDPVNLAAFYDITGNILLRGVYDAYNAEGFIGKDLVTEESDNQDVLRIPGLAPIDDQEMTVGEGEEYPSVKFGEDYIDRPASVKRGMKIGLTREMLFFDRTGQALQMASMVGERLGTFKDVRILKIVAGILNNFVRKGVARNTYVSSADPRINAQASLPLVDWTTLETAYLLFAQMGDDRAEAEPIDVHPNTLLVSPFKLWTAHRIIGATQIETPSQSASANQTTKTVSPNPASALSLSVKSSMRLYNLLVKSAASGGAGLTSTQAKQYWWYGDFKRAFRYLTLFPLQVQAANANHPDAFDRDVVAQFRADERGVAYVWAPWYVAEFHDT